MPCWAGWRTTSPGTEPRADHPVADQKREKKAPSVHTGHRKRTKDEFLANGLNGLPDHKVLELLLFYAIPQGDVNPLAHTLMEHFGSLAGVFHATPEQLMSVDGVGYNTAVLIRLIPAVAARYLQANSSFDGQLISTWQFRELLLPLFFGQRSELAYLVCMDGKSKLIVTKKLGEGIADTVRITARKVLETALGCNATRVALAHNHVSGVALWSDADVDTNLYLKPLLQAAGIELVDHFIIANDDMVSMADSGLLKD